MSFKYIKGRLIAKQEYVCLHCQLQSHLSQARFNLRYQHTSTQAANLTPGLPNGILPVQPLWADTATDKKIKKSKESKTASAILPAPEASQLRNTLHQKFLEKRRQEGLASPAPRVAKANGKSKSLKFKEKAARDKAVENLEVSDSRKSAAKEAGPKAENVLDAKKSKKKPATKRKGALKSEERAEKAGVKVLKASDAEKVEREARPPKRRNRRERKSEKPGLSSSRKNSTPQRSAGKASVTKRSSRSKLTERLKSDLTKLKTALEPKTNDESKLILRRLLSKLSKNAEFSTVLDAPSSPPLARQVATLRLRKISSDAPETPYRLKAAQDVVKFKKGETPTGGTIINRSRRVQAARGKVSTKLSEVAGHESLQAALRLKIQENTPQITKAEIERINAEDLKLLPLQVNRLPVPSLAYGLERVLFNPGVYRLQDPRSKVFNFDPYLQKIMPVNEFDFDALKEYITSSRDQSLKRLAEAYGKRFVGSTSSMTGALAHFHFLLSQWRSINTSMLSKTFPDTLLSFTELQRSPSAIFLRWQDGSYAIDADKQFDSANILMMLGKSMEKLLTLDTGEFERYRKSNPEQVTAEERNAPESFHYTTMGDFLMRSQLDAFDARLPGTGMFDLKTRAVVSIRMQPTNHEEGVGYQIKTGQGEWESFEREYYDMIRAAFLKYSLQVRMGRMDGIFVAYHNTDRIFGFQYISIEEMDLSLHGQRDTSVGDQEFKLSLELLNKVLDKATKKYPEKSLRLHLETREVKTPFMYIFAEPVTDEQIQEIQTQNNEQIEAFQRKLQGVDGKDSESKSASEEEDKWADIQANVQEAMARDEMSVADPREDGKTPFAAAQRTSSDSERSGTFEDGPLYRSRSFVKADEDGVAAPAVTEGEEGEQKEKDEAEEEEEEGDDKDTEFGGEKETFPQVSDLVELEDEEQAQFSAKNASGQVCEDASGAEGVTEAIDDETAIERNHAREVVFGEELGLDNEGDLSGPNENLESAAKPDSPNQGEDGVNEEDLQEEEVLPLIRDVDGEGQTASVDAASDPNQMDQADNSSDQGVRESGIEEQLASHNGELDSRADQPFLEGTDQEFKPATSSEVLAMTLTIRNKVNGEYVERPENLGPDDKWSIEYALEEVAKPERAWSLYLACQKRRRQKLDGWNEKQEKDRVNHYLKNLRELSRKGAMWLEEMDERDKGRKVAVLGQPIPPRVEAEEPAELSVPAEQQAEE